MRYTDDPIKHEVVKWAALYEHKMQLGSKPIFHLEAFVAKFMYIFKKWSIDMFGS
jgi:replication factor C subunit 3/5